MAARRQRFTCGLLWAAVVISFSGQSALGQLVLGTPMNLGQPVNTAAEWAPELSADGLTLYYQSGGYGSNADIHVATRDSVDGNWKDPQPIGPTINTRFGEGSPSLSTSVTVIGPDIVRPIVRAG